MTNLVSGQQGGLAHNQAPRPMQRPASRNALDSIHKGMNAKFTHVQSKVLLENIRPKAAGSKIPNGNAPTGAATKTRTLERLTPAQTTNPAAARSGRSTPSGVGASRASPGQTGASQQSDRSQLINKIKALQEELAGEEARRQALNRELERERADKTEQLQQIKFELQEKMAESERQSEEYHQKLLEAYELADQNRRAADTVLSESRQREEELRKRIEELEQQLGELREFVSMKEEMMGKMGEMREQIREERERYEEKTRSLNQMFESEKIR